MCLFAANYVFAIIKPIIVSKNKCTTSSVEMSKFAVSISLFLKNTGPMRHITDKTVDKIDIGNVLCDYKRDANFNDDIDIHLSQVSRRWG